ncbi:MAG TPA: oligosaccharide flippase family protein [Candidatus Nanoarchaeia archaeon]|nr:oligosaccharide flippase family protein [Candidatus Nanoarchaeia archaeon]
MIQKSKIWLYPWFRWTEKYLKTDTVYLAKGGFWLITSQVVAMAAGFGISLAFSHFFPKEGFGTYKFIISVVGLLGVFSLTQTGTAITRAIARGFNGALVQGFKTNFKWSFGLFLGGLGLAVYYFINDNYVLAASFLMAGVFLPITSSSSLYDAFLQGKKNFRQSTFFSMARNTLPALSMIVTIFLTDNVVILMAVYFMVSAAVAGTLFWLTKRKYRNENRDTDPELASYSGHLSAMEVIGQVANYLDKILVFHFLGAVPLAIYAFAIAPVEQLQGGKKILSSLIFPKLSERSFEELQQSGPRKALLLTVYALGLAGVYVLFAPYFYGFFYPQYVDAILYSQVYSLTLLAVSGTIFDSTLIAHNRKKELYVHRITMPILKIGLFLTLLPIFGIMGLVITHVFIRIFAGLLSYYLVMHPFKS